MNDTDTRAPPRPGQLPPALAGERFEWQGRAGRLSCYASATAARSGAAGPVGASGTAQAAGASAPLLLVHSINAAGSAYEVRPLYERLRGARTVYAPDLPGFGFSDRSDRPYTPRLMTDAVHEVVDRIRERHGDAPVDVVALSLACEFVARAAAERPNVFRSIALVSPTGFSMRSPVDGPDGANRGMPGLYRVLSAPMWRRGVFGLLTRRGTIRYFLQRTYGSKRIDEDLLDYDYLTTHVPGAENAPLLFVSGFLFSRDIGKIYSALQQPVWMTHGVRGDFTDYRRAKAFSARPNWRVDVWDTGALPHFEMPDEFARACEAFLADPKGFVGARA